MCHFNLTLMKVGPCTCNYPYIKRKHKGSASQEENIQGLTEGTPGAPGPRSFWPWSTEPSASFLLDHGQK